MRKLKLISSILNKLDIKPYANFKNSSNLTYNSKMIPDFLNRHDKTQVSLLDEKVILVDENDVFIGEETKKNSHLIKNIENGMLHRAFSIFLFDTKNRMLLQQRSDFKITYPDLWTNACCSHPLAVNSTGSIEETGGIDGIKKAAKRRLLYEFGIDVLNFETFEFITRVHYKASNEPFDRIFGEHEIDYILFIKGDYSINYNKNEIKSYKYVDVEELKKLLENDKYRFTPWFKLICNKFIFNWWLYLDDLPKIRDDQTIHRFL